MSESSLGFVSFPEVNENALKILQKRYFWKDGVGNLVETQPVQLYIRVSNVVAEAERKFGGNDQKVSKVASDFFEMIGSQRFIPNTPTLANAGRDRGQLAACYVLPIADSMEGIMDCLKAQALVQKSGGGTGFNFGGIRERNSLIASTGQRAAGPVPVIKLMNYMMSEFIIQGGMRNGANMGVLPITHPDIEEFITFKHEDGSCKSFNVSLAATDAFMNAVIEDLDWPLISPVDGRTVKTLKALDIFNQITQSAWETGDPGMLFIDTANVDNPTPLLGRLEATNPCGEQWLLPNEACTLGHHNLSKYFKANPEATTWEDNVDWEQYSKDLKYSIRFLDNVIEVNYYALPEIEKMHRDTNRKIGLGVMGFADLLIKLNIPYGSAQARIVADKIARFHREGADQASHELALERGSFGAFEGSAVQLSGWSAMRNACRTTVAPTGTTAIIFGCSTSIEPIFGLILRREQAGMTMYEVHPLFKDLLDAMSESDRQATYDYYFTNNTLQGCPTLSAETQALFVQANDVAPEDHIQMQATWQQWIDNSISKTINMPTSATIQQVRDAYIMAWQTGCKGITVYRDGSRTGQALSVASADGASGTIVTVVDNPSDNAGPLCPECATPMEVASGCEACHNCGYSVCKI